MDLKTLGRTLARLSDEIDAIKRNLAATPARQSSAAAQNSGVMLGKITGTATLTGLPTTSQAYNVDVYPGGPYQKSGDVYQLKTPKNVVVIQMDIRPGSVLPAGNWVWVSNQRGIYYMQAPVWMRQ